MKEQKNEEFFICEICGCKTHKNYEGSEPNTCEVCMPKIKEYRNCEIRNILDIIK